MELIRDVYDLTATFPDEEQYALTKRLHLAVTEGPALLARGYGFGKRSYFGRCIQVAHGALMEVDTFIQIAEEQGYLSKDHAARIYGEIETVSRLLRRLFKDLRNNAGPYLA